jgi:hypothetical protein
MAEQRGVTVCRLPPYHCELNLVELVCSQIKRYVAVHNTQFKASFINDLIDNAFDAVSDNQWANYCKHKEHIEQEMWKADNLQDDVGLLIVQLADSSSSSSTVDSNDSRSDSQGSIGMTGLAPLHYAGRLLIVCTYQGSLGKEQKSVVLITQQRGKCTPQRRTQFLNVFFTVLLLTYIVLTIFR